MSPHDPISLLARMTRDQITALHKLHIVTIADLLNHLPNRYIDPNYAGTATELVKGAPVTLYGMLSKVSVKRSFKGHIPMTEARLEDATGGVRLVFFNQAYIGKIYPEGSYVKVSGTVQEDSKGFMLSNPHIEHAEKGSLLQGTALFGEPREDEPYSCVYPETKGISSQYLHHLITRAFELGYFDMVPDLIPPHISEELHLPKLSTALIYAHFPTKESHFQAAKKRFAFQEIFLLQVFQAKERADASHELAYSIDNDQDTLARFLSHFSFTPTNAQLEAIRIITRDMTGNIPMARLLEGDVGSGKTLVAAAVSYLTTHTYDTKTKQNLQAAFMAPTEILAKQHFEGLCDLFRDTDISVGLLTGSGCKKFPSKTHGQDATPCSRAQLLKWVKEGRVNLIVGTHALIQKSVTFAHLALVIIDEQHRFGIKQRGKLAHKVGDVRKEIPHLLSMTATPIPRTLALTLFGDLDLSVLDEVPKERLPIITETVTTSGREKMYAHMRTELDAGRQAYVICPRINEQDEEAKQERQLKSVTEEREALQTRFPDLSIDILHSKMKTVDKETVMQAYLAHEIDILVATSVVEVGVNVPNASVIIIEGADRFGLAQLHQLRGRVGRSHHQSYCYLIGESTSDKTKKRLSALTKAKNGFELAEIDMAERGIGTLMDSRQWGMSDAAMEALKNPKLVELAREKARAFVEHDPNLTSYPPLFDRIAEYKKVHME